MAIARFMLYCQERLNVLAKELIFLSLIIPLVLWLEKIFGQEANFFYFEELLGGFLDLEP